MLTTPTLEHRAEQPYVAIRATPTMSQIGLVAGPLIGEVFGWLAEQGISPAGPPFFRYLVIDMERELELHVGVPVVRRMAGDGRVLADAFPEGQYLTALYTGHYDGLASATGEFLAWADANGIEWDRTETPAGEAWGSRTEHYLSDPETEPDPSRRKTLLAFRVRTSGSPPA
jgi:effector-binding domain-containing protein